MFDFGKFTNWLTGGLLDSLSTWESYKTEEHSWQATARQLSAPLMVFWGLGAVIFGWLFGNGHGFAGFLSPIISGVIWFALAGFFASFLAKNFGGNASFDQAFAALTFATIPTAIGSVIGTLPYIGWLITIAGYIWTIMLLWQSLPVFLDIPSDKRVGHFFATLGLSIVSMILVFFVLGAIGLGGALLGNSAGSSSSDGSGLGIDHDRSTSYNQQNNASGGSNSSSNNSSQGSSTRTAAQDSGADLFGFGREVDYIESAGMDTYSPPADGMLQEAQVERAAKFFAAANRLREASTESLERLDDKNNKPSLGDLFKGVKGLVSAGTAEMQAVKSGGGNWAEHEWVKRQLFEARIHQDLNGTTQHNYELYQAYESEVGDWL